MTLLIDYWKPVVGFENHYEVSCTGKIRGIKSGKTLSPDLGNRGYYLVSLKVNGKKKRVSVHRLVAECFISNMASGMEVNHKNTVRLNNHASNLEVLSPRENVEHYWASPAAKKRMIAAEKIKDVRERYKTQTAKQIASALGISHHSVYDIVRGKRGWRVS